MRAALSRAACSGGSPGWRAGSSSAASSARAARRRTPSGSGSRPSTAASRATPSRSSPARAASRDVRRDRYPPAAVRARATAASARAPRRRGPVHRKGMEEDGSSILSLMPSALRFRPPRLALSPEVRWMLLRAFGPAGAPFPEPVEPAAALPLARRFQVPARIAVRQGRERLRAEVGEEITAGFARDRARAAAVGMRLMGEVRRVAEVAAGLGCPLACLKLAALEGTGLLAAGSREACDADLLVPGGRAEELWQALAVAGFRGSGMPEAEHQLTALKGPQGGVVEIHRHLPGVRLEGAASATYEALDRAGLLLPLPDLPGRCLAPAPEVLAAHVLVHGLGQHGYWPSSYSLLKMVADLLDLGSLTDRAAAWVARDVSAAETAAVRRLTGRLAAGEDPAGWTGPEEELLRHILA